MSNYRDLHIDRSKIIFWIEEHFKNNYENEPSKIEQQKINENQIRYNIYLNGSKYFIDFYFNKSDTTSINASVGNDSNRRFIAPLADHIKSKHKSYVGAGKSMSVGLCEDDYRALIDLLSEENELVGSSNSPQTNAAKYFLHHFRNKLGDEITLKYYPNTHNLQIQGKLSTLFEEIVSYLSGDATFEELMFAQADYCSIAVEPNEIDNDIKAHLPAAYGFLEEKHRSLIGSSIIYSRIDVNAPDFGILVQPVMRALEGYIKKLFATKGIPVKDFGGFGEFICGYINDKGKLAEEYCSLFANQRQVSIIEKLCNYYSRHRTGLSHAGANDSQVRVIEGRDEALRLINETLLLINRTFVDFIGCEV